MPIRAVVCDIDHTLTTTGSLTALAQAMKVPPAAQAALYRRYRATLSDGSRADADVQAGLLALWQATGRATRDRITTVFCQIPLRPGAHSLAAALRARGIPLCLITSSAAMYAHITAERLGACCGYGNATFTFDRQGYLQDLDLDLATGELKVRQLNQFCADHAVDPSHVIALGNGPTDLELFDATGHGVLLTTITHLHHARRAWRTITTLETLPTLIDEADNADPCPDT